MKSVFITLMTSLFTSAALATSPMTFCSNPEGTISYSTEGIMFRNIFETEASLLSEDYTLENDESFTPILVKEERFNEDDGIVFTVSTTIYRLSLVAPAGKSLPGYLAGSENSYQSFFICKSTY